jgi:hypothetical protein
MRYVLWAPAIGHAKAWMCRSWATSENLGEEILRTMAVNGTRAKFLCASPVDVRGKGKKRVMGRSEMNDTRDMRTWEDEGHGAATLFFVLTSLPRAKICNHLRTSWFPSFLGRAGGRWRNARMLGDGRPDGRSSLLMLVIRTAPWNCDA